MKLKVNLLPIILVLLLTIIVCIGIHIYHQTEGNNTKNNEEILENVINNENYIVNEENKQNENLENLAKNKISKYLKLSVYERNNIGPMPNILSELELESIKNLEKLCENSNNPSEYIKSNVKYDIFKEALIEYVTEEYFDTYYSQYKNMDGYVGFCNCAGSFIEVEVEDIKLVSKTEEECVFDVTFKDVELYTHYLNGENISKDEYLFNDNIKMKIINKELFISDFLNNEIILDGSYIIENSDVSYDFCKNGTVITSTNLSELKGFYTTNGEKKVKIIFTEKTIWSEENFRDQEVTEVYIENDVEIIDEENIIIESKENNYRQKYVKFISSGI